MRKRIPQIILLGAALTLASAPAMAVPYASGIIRDGNTVSYLLNQTATKVELILDGGSPVSQPTTPGRHSFDLTGHTTFEIKVTGNDAPGWTQYVPDQAATSFYIPLGVSINKNPSSTNFGKVYISEAGGGTPEAGLRSTQDGIYMLNPDGSEAGFSNGGQIWSGNSSPYRTTIGPDGHLYVADLSNDLAYEFNDDMSVATLLIDDSNRTADQWVGGIWVEGTKAEGNRKIYLLNRNYDDLARKGLIMYDLGANDTATAFDTGTQIIGPSYFVYYPYDVTRDGNGDWYLTQYRATAGQAPAVSKFDGSLPAPINSAVWEVPSSYFYSDGLDLDPTTGAVAVGRYDNGVVNFFDPATGAWLNSFDAGNRCRELAFDAAGNIVTVDNGAEWARFWSPGGYTVASTRFNGSQTAFELSRPAAQVSVTAASTTVSEAGPAVQFTIARAVATGSPLTVYYTMSGTATNGVDYTALSGEAVIPANAISVDIPFNPIDDAISELTETAILTLAANSNYSAVLPTSATISILDNDAPEIAFTVAAPKRLLESYAPSKVTHEVVRRGLLDNALTVNISYSGSAVLGAHFNGPASVSLGAGVAAADLVLTPVNNQAAEGDKIVTANIAAGTGYGIGAPSAVSATVVDDDPPPGTVLFSDDFDTDSSALWQVNLADPYDSFVDFAWDYSVAGIPVAPGTTDGSTKGLRMRTGNTYLQIDALSLSPLGKTFTGDYRLKFDMWINYNGPLPDGGPGSTQNLDAGVGTAGDLVVWQNNPAADGVWFSVNGDGGDGNTGGDYNALIGPNIQNDDSGFYAAGIGAPNSGLRDNGHPYYSLWGGQTAPAAQLGMYPGQSGVANRGNAGMAWHTVVITKLGNVVTWAMDGIPLATVTNTGPFGDNLFIGYQDLFASGSLSDQPEMSFGLVDNLRVQTLVAPVTPNITGIQLINSGAQVKISFTAGAGDIPSAFGLVNSATVSGYYEPAAATITSPEPGQFEAVTAVSGPTRFYRVLRH